jgi:hypothetical protein
MGVMAWQCDLLSALFPTWLAVLDRAGNLL